MSGIVCLLGLFLLPKSMATHLDMNHKRWSRTRELGCSRWASKSYVFLQWLGNCMELLRTPAIPQSIGSDTNTARGRGGRVCTHAHPGLEGEFDEVYGSSQWPELSVASSPPPCPLLRALEHLLL